jgi:hypothetical protein
MNANAFLVNITTEPIDPTQYTKIAETILKSLQSIVDTNLEAFTKPHVSEPWCDVQASLDSDKTVQVVMVLFGRSQKPWSLDKNKLTALLRAELPITVKLTKRSMDKNELAKVEHEIEDSSAQSQN